MSRPWAIFLVWTLLMLAGCRPFGKPKPAPALPLPPPPKPVAAEPPKVEAAGPPPKIEAAQQPEPEVPSAVAVIPKPPAPKPTRRRPTKNAGNPAAPATTVTTDAAAVPSTPAPPPLRLGELLSDNQRQQLLESCDASLGRAREAIGRLRGVTLTPAQKDTLARIRIFIDQAGKSREKDPQTARQLAERADLLSQDLVRNIRH